MRTSRYFAKKIRLIGALVDGHHVFKMGEHSPLKLEARKITAFPHLLEELSKGIATFYKDFEIDLVVAPAMGAIVLGNRVAFNLGKDARSIFGEKDSKGNFIFAEGNEEFIKAKTKVLVVEDITTRGSTIREIIQTVKKNKADVVGIGLIWNRGGVKFDLPNFSCVDEILPDYSEKSCPQCKEGVSINTNDKYGKLFIDKYGKNPKNWPANQSR